MDRAESMSRLLANDALLTDLYELTMLQAYHASGMNETAVFEFFARDLPPQRNFLIAAGLAQVVEYLTQLRFTQTELAWLESTSRFRPEFLRSLADLRFSGLRTKPPPLQARPSRRA